jgi:hypothetical protein
MSAVGLLNHIDGQKAECVDAEQVEVLRHGELPDLIANRCN